MKNLLPEQLTPRSLELYGQRHMNSSQIIYALLLLFLLSAMVALPLIEIDVFTSSPGMIRTDSESVQIRAAATGIVRFTGPRENALVQQGDTLVIITNDDLSAKESLLSQQLDSLNVQIADLGKLISSSFIEESVLKSASLRADYGEFKSAFMPLERNRQMFRINFRRQKSLFDKGVIALADLENSKYRYERSVDDLELLISGQKRKWHEKLKTHDFQRKEILVSLHKIRQKKKDLIVISPISGYVRLLGGIQPGMRVEEGLPLLEIVPEAGLIVKCYVPAREIGRLRPDQDVEYHIPYSIRSDAKTSRGKVLSIAPDVEVKNEKPVFEVRCSLDTTLSEPRGKKKQLKNGMILIARFRLARRTVFDLLVEDFEDLQGNFS